MKAVLLCAGYGTRLYPLTRNRPKPLLPIGGKPILEHLLEKIEKLSSVDHVFLVTNDRFQPYFQKWAREKKYSRKIEVINDGTRTNETRLGAIGDLRFVIQKFRIDDDLGVFAADNLFLFDLPDFFSFAESHRPHVSVGVVDIGNRELARKYGIVRAGEGGRIVEFCEKPQAPPTTLVSTGIYWIPREGLDFLDRYVKEGHNADRLGDYVGWLVKTSRVFAHPFEGKWFDIGDMDSYREADQLFQKAR